MRRYHKTSSLSSYQWQKKYNEYKHAFEFNKKRTGDFDPHMITKTEFKRVYKDQIGIKADRRAREIANQQFFNISQKLATDTRRRLEEEGGSFSTTEIRAMTTKEIADTYKEYGLDLNEVYHQMKAEFQSKGLSDQEAISAAKHYISVNYYNSL